MQLPWFALQLTQSWRVQNMASRGGASSTPACSQPHFMPTRARQQDRGADLSSPTPLSCLPSPPPQIRAFLMIKSSRARSATRPSSPARVLFDSFQARLFETVYEPNQWHYKRLLLDTQQGSTPQHCSKESCLLSRSAVVRSSRRKKTSQSVVLTVTPLQNSFARLKQLAVENYKLGQKDMSDLKQQLASGALEKLSLRGCELSSREIPDLLLKLQACTKLKSLNLSRNRISDQTGWLTVLLEKLPGIETLMLKRCNLQTLEIPACELRVLSVSDNRMAWLTVSERTPLQTLLADSTGLMMNRLVKDLPLSLRQLSARQCELTEASAKTILRQLAHLQKLSISHCPIKGFLNSAQLIQLQCAFCDLQQVRLGPTLRAVDLSGNRLTQSTIESATALLRYSCQLSRLKLNNCGLTDLTSEVLFRAVSVSLGLEALELKDNNLKERGGRLLLEAIKGCASLLQVQHSGNIFSLQLEKHLGMAIQANRALSTPDALRAEVKELEEYRALLLGVAEERRAIRELEDRKKALRELVRKEQQKLLLLSTQMVCTKYQ